MYFSIFFLKKQLAVPYPINLDENHRAVD